MTSSFLRLAVFGSLVAFGLGGSATAAPEAVLDWKSDESFASLRSEIAEVQSTAQLAKDYPKLATQFPNAPRTLDEVRSLILNRLSGGSRGVRLVGGPNRGNQATVPSIYTHPTQVPNTLQPAFEARKAAYVALAKTAQPIPELSLVSTMLLHRLETITDEVAFDSMSTSFAFLLKNERSNFQLYLSINESHQARLEAAVVMIQLADRLGRMEDVQGMIAGEASKNHQVESVKARLLALTMLYLPRVPGAFLEVAPALFCGQKISYQDLLTAAKFKEYPYSTVGRVLKESLGFRVPIESSIG